MTIKEGEVIGFRGGGGEIVKKISNSVIGISLG
jgi:hypothetical protein